MGMHLEARLSETLGFIDAEMVKEIRTLIESYGLSTGISGGADGDSLFASMQMDKKAVSGERKFILCEKIGAVKIHKGVSQNECSAPLKH
jgi:3-dehydroquinate synthetase